MADDPYNICFLTDPLSVDDVRDVARRCSDAGFRWEGEADSLQAYVDASLDEESATLEFRYDDVLEVSLFFNCGPDWEWNDPKLLVSFSVMALDTNVEFSGYTPQQVRDRISALLDLIRTLTRTVDPEYGWGMLVQGPAPDTGLRPTERPISDQIERLSWITVLSKSLVAAFGGRERVLRTPAWRVEELDTGHVLIVRTDNPVDPTEGPPGAPEQYLLGGKRPGERQTTRPRIDDPFRHLSPGDFGADVVIEQANVDGDPTNDDLELVRCEVDDEYRLWEVETGAFVRRVFDENGEAFGEDPYVPSEEFHPPLVHASVPVEFVALDDPDDENLVTNVMGLDVEVDKLRLLVSLATMVEEADDRESALATAESIVDDAARARDADGVERLLRRLL